MMNEGEEHPTVNRPTRLRPFDSSKPLPELLIEQAQSTILNAVWHTRQEANSYSTSSRMKSVRLKPPGYGPREAKLAKPATERRDKLLETDDITPTGDSEVVAHQIRGTEPTEAEKVGQIAYRINLPAR